MEILKKDKAIDKVELAYWAQKFAKQSGAENSSVVISKNRSVSVEYRDGNIDKLSESTENSLWIEIFAGGKYSSHSTNDLRQPVLEKFIKDSVNLTAYLGEDPYQALPDPELYKDRPAVDLQLFDSSYYKMETEERVARSKAMYEAIKDRDSRINSVTSYFNDSRYENIHIKSNGFEGMYENSSFGYGAEVSMQDKDGKPQSWSYYSVRHLDDLPPMKQIADEAFQRTLDSFGREKIDSVTLPMILENRVAGNLLGRLRGPLSGGSLQQKQSFLEGKLGKQIASDKLTLVDDPLIVRGIRSRYYDGDGISARVMPVIENGILKNYYIDVYYGRKLEMQPTTGGSSNMTFDLGNRSGKEIEKDMDKAILVTQFLGGNSNGTTGDFSLGVAGWLIENGERTVPVKEMNISGNFSELLMNLNEIGNDPYIYGSMRTPTIVFDGVSFAGL